ncbi:hypothetical protein [Microbacterium enclense]|uniref:hypothetical protein n=1 Tax=Microbacterium enclense TaxID=993073 RepID=UPI003F823ABA
MSSPSWLQPAPSTFSKVDVHRLGRARRILSSSTLSKDAGELYEALRDIVGSPRRLRPMFAPLFDAEVRAHDECQREPVSADGRQRAEDAQQASRFERVAVELLLSPEDSPDEAEDDIREVAEQIARHMYSRVPDGGCEDLGRTSPR